MSSFDVEKALELYREIQKQPSSVREALFNALRRDLDEEARGD